MKTNYPTKKLGEVIEFLPKSSRRAGDGLDKGKFPFFTSSPIQKKFLNIADYKEEAIILGTGGSASIHICKNFSTSADVFIIKSLDANRLENKYLYLFLVANKSALNEGFKGAALKHLSKEYLKNLEIPLPSIKEQKKIVAKLEKVLAKINEAKKLRAEAQKNTDNLLSTELHKIFEEGKKKGWEEKELGEVFVLNYGKGLPRSERSEDGKYIVYGANGELGRSDKYLIEGDGIIIGRKGSAGEITRVSGKYWPTDVTYFVTEDKNYHIGFTYYLFKFLNFPQYVVGVKPGINRNQLYEIKILLPSLAEQKKIVARLDKLSQKIEEIKKLQAATQNEFTILEQSILSKAFKGGLTE